MLVCAWLRYGGARAGGGGGAGVCSDELHRFVLSSGGEVVVDEGVECRLVCLLCLLCMLLLLELALLLGVLSCEPLLVLVEEDALLGRGGSFGKGSEGLQLLRCGGCQHLLSNCPLLGHRCLSHGRLPPRRFCRSRRLRRCLLVLRREARTISRGRGRPTLVRSGHSLQNRETLLDGEGGGTRGGEGLGRAPRVDCGG